MLGADTKKFRTKDSIQILEYAYRTYSPINLKEKIETEWKKWKQQNTIEIEKGKVAVILPKLAEIPYEQYFVKPGEESKIKIQIECETQKEAPVLQGTQVGSMKITKGGEEITTLPLTISETIEKKEPIDYWQELWRVYSCNELQKVE